MAELRQLTVPFLTPLSIKNIRYKYKKWPSAVFHASQVARVARVVARAVARAAARTARPTARIARVARTATTCKYFI